MKTLLRYLHGQAQNGALRHTVKYGSENTGVSMLIKRLLFCQQTQKRMWSLKRTVSHSKAPVFSLDFHRQLPKVTWILKNIELKANIIVPIVSM